MTLFLHEDHQQVADSSLDSFSVLAISSTQIVPHALLPGDHRDPFDRILAAQSTIENMAMITIDKEMLSLGVLMRW